jgi:hypothetical protein
MTLKAEEEDESPGWGIGSLCFWRTEGELDSQLESSARD